MRVIIVHLGVVFLCYGVPILFQYSIFFVFCLYKCSLSSGSCHNKAQSIMIYWLIFVIISCFLPFDLQSQEFVISLDYLMPETGESNLKVIAVHASVHLPYDHNLLVQNLTTQVIEVTGAFLSLLALFVNKSWNSVIQSLPEIRCTTNKLRTFAYFTQVISSRLL